MEYYAKSENSQGHQETVKEHLQKVAALAREYGEALGLADAAKLGAHLHDFGKYTKASQDVLKGTRTGVDHAISSACFLECCYKGSPGSCPVIEAVNGHHDGLVAYDMIKAELHAIADDCKQSHGSAGKTLALLHFALRHCLKHGKKQIIIVLPFLTLAEQNAKTYSEIIPNVLVDHSQSDLPEEARELAARWSAPVIITTSVRFFEALFSDRPAVCRKLHNIANSVVAFDEAQSLPANLTSATLRAVNELCRRYHTAMVFSTATQPDFAARGDLNWTPREILPEHRELFEALRRADVEWRLEHETPLEAIAEEMAGHDSVCTIVNLRRHARQIAAALARLRGDPVHRGWSRP